jgi:hypothetical protein
MGVSITIDKDYDQFLSPDKKAKFHYRVVTCTIDYSSDGEGAVNGKLIYIKPAINEREPFDVYTYRRESATFPHESTADQWFSEAQFECYRFLGEAIAQEIKWGDEHAWPTYSWLGGRDGIAQEIKRGNDDGSQSEQAQSPVIGHPDKGRTAAMAAAGLLLEPQQDGAADDQR